MIKSMADAVVYQLHEAVQANNESIEVLRLIVYVPFGVVRAEVTSAEIRNLFQTVSDEHHLIRFQNAAVEHYSNHLPTGNYEQLFLNTKEIAGLVIL